MWCLRHLGSRHSNHILLITSRYNKRLLLFSRRCNLLSLLVFRLPTFEPLVIASDIQIAGVFLGVFLVLLIELVDLLRGGLCQPWLCFLGDSLTQWHLGALGLGVLVAWYVRSLWFRVSITFLVWDVVHAWVTILNLRHLLAKGWGVIFIIVWTSILIGSWDTFLVALHYWVCLVEIVQIFILLWIFICLISLVKLILRLKASRLDSWIELILSCGLSCLDSLIKLLISLKTLFRHKTVSFKHQWLLFRLCRWQRLMEILSSLRMLIRCFLMHNRIYDTCLLTWQFSPSILTIFPCQRIILGYRRHHHMLLHKLRFRTACRAGNAVIAAVTAAALGGSRAKLLDAHLGATSVRWVAGVVAVLAAVVPLWVLPFTLCFQARHWHAWILRVDWVLACSPH